MGIHRREDRPMGVAVRGYFRSPLSEDQWLSSWLELWDGAPHESALLPGYGWAFPVGDGTVNVGLGMLNSSDAFRKTDYRALMKRWLSHTPPEWGLTEANQEAPIRGAALPMALNRAPAYRDGLLLVGDAAGMVNPFNGEGIDYAMEAGEMAADAIAEAHYRGIGTRSAERALEGYQSRIKAQLGGYYRLGTVFVKLIGDPRVMKLCTTYGLPRKSLMRLVNKLLANLTDARDGDLSDRLINTLTRLAPSA
jgi:flavin-dependent dehydrogenase